MLYDPIPDPIAAGWTKEGDESHVPAGTSLQISDGTNAGFVRFFAVDPAAFTGEIELNPSVPLASGFSVDAEGSSGVHVAINDGERQIRVAVLGEDGGGIRVAIKLLTGYTTGFGLPTTQATFQVKRLAPTGRRAWRWRDGRPSPSPGCSWRCPGGLACRRSSSAPTTGAGSSPQSGSRWGSRPCRARRPLRPSRSAGCNSASSPSVKEGDHALRSDP
jgi:hypothetical protein